MNYKPSKKIIDHIERQEHAKAVALFKSLDKDDSDYIKSLFTITEMAIRDKINFPKNDIELWVKNLDDELLSDNALANYLKGLYYYDIKEYEKAEDNLNKCLKLNNHFKPAIDLLSTVLLESEKWEEAERLLKKMVSPNEMECHNLVNLAIAQMRQNKLIEALESAKKGKVISRPDQISSVHVNLGTIYQELGRFGKAKYHYKKALSINSCNTNTFINLGVLEIQQRNFLKAEIMLRKALQIDPTNIKAKVNLAGTLLIQNKVSEGWDLYEARLINSEHIMEEPKGIMKWNGKDKCKELLLVHEQGFGDTFQFIRYAEYMSLKGIKCSFYGPKKLHGIISTSDHISGCYSNTSELPKNINYWVAMMSLPSIAGASLNDDKITTKPYLCADRERINK